MNFFKLKGKGIFVCLLIALFAWLLTNTITFLSIIGAPVIGILTGMIFSILLKNKTTVKDGITFTSKKILQFAVILLGFGLNLTTIAKVGVSSLPIIVSTISISLLVAYILQKLLKTPINTSILIGVGSSICGGSAIAATAPVVDANDTEIAQSISVIFLFNVIAAILFPTLGSLLGLSNSDFALFAGTAINDTSSVTAAAATWDTLHGTNGTVLEYATIVKLTRTLAIIPITFVLSLLRIKREKNTTTQRNLSVRKLFPMFILYFILASIVTTIITSFCTGYQLQLAQNTFVFLKQVSKFLIVMAMSAIGLNTNIITLIKNGGKPILMGFCCWIAIILMSLCYIFI